MSRRRRRRSLDVHATMEKYIARIQQLPREILEEARDAYLSTFEVYNTISRFEACSQPLQQSNAVRLMRCLRELDVPVKGVTSERKKDKHFICSVLLDGQTRDDVRIIYVGQFNYFTNHTPHPQFSLRAEDKVYADAS